MEIQRTLNLLNIVAVMSCSSSQDVINKDCFWSEPTAELSISGANGLRSLLIQSKCLSTECDVPTQIIVNDEAFSVDLKKTESDLLAVLLIPLENYSEEGIDKMSPTTFGERVLSSNNIQISFKNENEQIICIYETILISQSQLLRP